MEAKNVCKNYGKLEAVKNVSLQIRKGDIKLIFGPSGSGKSTFLRCMAMLDMPDSQAKFTLERNASPNQA